MSSPGERVEPPRRPVLLVNPRSGDGTADRVGLVEAAHDLGIEVVLLEPGDDLPTLVREAVARGADALGVAGGDGSLGTVAAIASDHGLPFVCVPAGTRNHFALDVGLDRRDPLSALGAFIEPHERRIDLGVVNGRAFVNNVSLGVYGDAVGRPDYREAKLRTMLETAEEVFGPSAEATGVAVVDDLGSGHVDPVVLLVSNNAYALEAPGRAGGRPRLDAGTLGVIVVDAPRPPRPPTGRAWTTPSLEIDAAETVHAGVDGEAVDLSPPLRLESRPAALRVLLPAHRRRSPLPGDPFER